MWPVVASLFIGMAPLFEILTGHSKRHFGAGETIIVEESTTGELFLLIDGEVEVYKDNVQLATTSEPGSVFGEMSALLGTSHRASVRTVTPSSLYFVEDSRRFLDTHPVVSMHALSVLPRRRD